MKRSDWEDIQKKSPNALKDCRNRFEEQTRDGWQKRMRDKEELLEFFRTRGMTIVAFQQIGGKFRYRIELKGDLPTDTKEEAWTRGFKAAFFQLERELNMKE